MEQDIKQAYDESVSVLVSGIHEQLKEFLLKYEFPVGENIDWDTIQDGLADLKCGLWSATPKRLLS